MQSSTVLVLACLVAVVVAHTHYEYPAAEALDVPYEVYEASDDAPVVDGARNKRSLLLKKKFLLGSLLGLKAVKVAGLGAGAAAIALKSHKKPSVTKEIIINHPHQHHQNHYGYKSHGPSWHVDVHSWH